MKLNTVLLLGLLLLLGLSGYVNVRQHEENKEAKKRLETINQVSNKQSVIIGHYLGPDSAKHVEYRMVYAKTDTEKELAVSPTYVDSLRQALDIKTGQLAELTHVKAVVTAKVKTTVTSDSLGQKQYSYKNKWLSLSLNSGDSIASYIYKLELTNTRHQTGNWLLGKTWHNEISIADPNATIVGIDAFRPPTEKQKRMGLGLQAGYYYDPLRGVLLPALGLGFSYNLIQF